MYDVGDEEDKEIAKKQEKDAQQRDEMPEDADHPLQTDENGPAPLHRHNHNIVCACLTLNCDYPT